MFLTRLKAKHSDENPEYGKMLSNYHGYVIDPRLVFQIVRQERRSTDQKLVLQNKYIYNQFIKQ